MEKRFILLISGTIILVMCAITYNYHISFIECSNDVVRRNTDIHDNDMASLYKGKDLPSPCDRITIDNLKKKGDYIMLNITDVRISNIANTKSMDPVIDGNSNTLKIKPRSMHQVCVGDIVTYLRWNKKENKTDNIIHRVVYKGRDRHGDYIILRGDNNFYDDPEKIRYENVTGVVVGILY